MRRRKRKRKNQIDTDLDLHGIKHQDVDVTVEDYILFNTPPFKIITGHSLTMKKLTIAVLNRHQYKFQDGVLSNMGCILVTSE
jgi:hypothetical protein